MKFDGWNFLVGSGITSVVIYYGTRRLMNNHVFDSDYFKEAYSCLLNNPEAVEQLGEPITRKEFGFFERVCHICDSGYHFDIPVKGSKLSGTLIYWVTGRPSKPGIHQMYKTELEFEDPSVKKILIKDVPINTAEE